MSVHPSKRRSWTTAVFAALVIALLAGSIAVLDRVQATRAEVTLEEVLYLPSPQAVKRLSLGYNGLMADIYWTRVVQYFGGHHHAHDSRYKLLSPLLDITTTLDPQLVPAYEFGSVFLAQSPPEGAGDPHAAAALVERGIAQNPKAWRLYYHLGFIYWVELHDPATASQCFYKGSQVEGAMPWMRVMAAALAQHAGQAETAQYLWENILQSAEDPFLRANAERRLLALRVDAEVRTLQAHVDKYTAAVHHVPAGWNEMGLAGWIRRLPVDPLGYPYQLREGRVQVSRPDLLPFITQGRAPGQQARDLPQLPAR